MYEKHKLNNGIQVVLTKLPVYRSASIGIWVKAGSINESKDNNGVSHFIEHMLFKGTQTRSAKDIAEFFDGIGGDMNAFTSKECTCFHAKVLDKHLLEAIEVMGDMISNPMMAEEEIIKEKGVVLDEIYMAEDTPDDVSYDLIAETIFKHDSLGQPILGSKESIDSMDRQIIDDYMARYYTNENIIIAIAGSFETDEVLEALNQNFRLPSDQRKIELPLNTFHSDKAFIYRDIEQVHLEIAYEGISYCSEKVFALAAINAMMGSSVSSRLFQNIREDHGLTYAINSYVSQYETCGLFNIYASMGVDNLEKVLILLSKEIQDVYEHGFTEDELSRVKEQLKGNYILDLEGSESYMNLIGKGTLFNKPIYTVSDIENRINDISLASVNTLTKEILGKAPAFSLVGRVDEKTISMCKAYIQGEQ